MSDPISDFELDYLRPDEHYVLAVWESIAQLN